MVDQWLVGRFFFHFLVDSSNYSSENLEGRRGEGLQCELQLQLSQSILRTRRMPRRNGWLSLYNIMIG
ncbi:hypothetical protein M514_07439 [Trichuris suis]|uniref:Uncharacterized protein n=1 Tax=Trichuris suis TaxID=68888 RepID=A0A085NCD2_9BILA|nr:hypothetical protein M514_07439 [Trichuris suis]